jgi:hypothetical protein
MEAALKAPESARNDGVVDGRQSPKDRMRELIVDSSECLTQFATPERAWIHLEPNKCWEKEVKQNEKPSSRCDRVRVIDESDLRIVLVRKQNVLEGLICLMFRDLQFLCEGGFLVNGQSEYRRDGGHSSTCRA